jgi:hypothetical protein
LIINNGRKHTPVIIATFQIKATVIINSKSGESEKSVWLIRIQHVLTLTEIILQEHHRNNVNNDGSKLRIDHVSMPSNTAKRE